MKYFAKILNGFQPLTIFVKLFSLHFRCSRTLNSGFWIHTKYKKKKISIKNFFSKCGQIRSFLRTWSHLLKKSFMENLQCSDTITQNHKYCDKKHEDVLARIVAAIYIILIYGWEAFNAYGNAQKTVNCLPTPSYSMFWKKWFTDTHQNRCI